MNHRGLFLALITFAVLPLAAWAQAPDFSKVEIKTEKLSDNTYMLIGAGGNIGVSVGDDGVFIVDDQFAPLTPKIQAAVSRLSAQPIRFVLNTHWHFDHTGGNENLGKAGAVIVAHDNARKRLSTEQFIEFLGTTVKPSPHKALPVITFTTDIRFHVNGDDVHVFHVAAGHTDGDAIVHFRKSNVFHLGDLYFNKLYPFIDTTSGGTIEGTVAAVDRVLDLADDNSKIIPGHGPLSNKAELKSYRDMLSTVSDRVRRLMKEGKTLEEVVATRPTAEFDEVWSKGFLPPAKFIEMLWKNLRK